MASFNDNLPQISHLSRKPHLLPDCLNRCGKIHPSPKCGWLLLAAAQMKCSRGTLFRHWWFGPLWPLSSFTLLLPLLLIPLLISELVFPGFSHSLRTCGFPGNLQVLSAWLGFLEQSASGTKQLLGCQTPHCETASPGLQRHQRRRLSNPQSLSLSGVRQLLLLFQPKLT